MEQSSALHGKHLVISGLSNAFSFNLERNSSGFVTRISGVGGRMLDWLSLYHSFSYSPLQIDDDIDFDNTRKGLALLIQKGECDIVGAVLPTVSRSRLVDFTHPVVYNPGYFLIPAPTESLNISAAILPFQLSVWIGIVVAILAIIFSFYSFNYLYFLFLNEQKENQNRIAGFVFGLLLGQARLIPNKSKNMPSLVIGATWGFATLILINSYTSLLTSYITAPSSQSFVKSVQELRDRTDIWIVTDKNRNSESLLMSAETGVLKDLGDRLRMHPNFICKTPLQCVEMVKSSGSSAYVATRDGYLLKGMADDFQATQKCNTEMGKEEIFIIRSPWALMKNSPYTEDINKGIMRMQQTGLMNKWMNEYRPNTDKCLNKMNGKSNNSPILSLGNLLVTFVSLMAGFIVSLLVFIGEAFIFAVRKTRARRKIMMAAALDTFW